jgi:catechol 2,3-dioxygenase-like lactoylglutathione lyase family enzyme
MSIQLDHLLIPCSNREAAAKRLAQVLGVTWGPANVGPFTSVYVSDSLTIDFDQWVEQFAQGHYCFRVSDDEFDAVLQRIKEAELPFRSTPHGPADFAINTSVGGRIVYWSEPDGHVWEVLTQSYARKQHG